MDIDHDAVLAEIRRRQPYRRHAWAEADGIWRIGHGTRRYLGTGLRCDAGRRVREGDTISARDAEVELCCRYNLVVMEVEERIPWLEEAEPALAGAVVRMAWRLGAAATARAIRTPAG